MNQQTKLHKRKRQNNYARPRQKKKESGSDVSCKVVDEWKAHTQPIVRRVPYVHIHIHIYIYIYTRPIVRRVPCVHIHIHIYIYIYTPPAVRRVPHILY